MKPNRDAWDRLLLLIEKQRKHNAAAANAVKWSQYYQVLECKFPEPTRRLPLGNGCYWVKPSNMAD